MNEKSGIAVAGSVLVDQINEISAYPKSGELTKIIDVSRAVGGCVPNVSIDLKKMRPGLPVYAIGKVGADSNGAFAKTAMSDCGVDVSEIRTDEASVTSFTQVMSVFRGERTFFTHPGASAEFAYHDVDFDALPVKMLHLGYFLLLDRMDAGDGEKILAECQRRGIMTSIDFVTENSDRYQSLQPILPLVDNLILNEVEACRLAGVAVSADNICRAAEILKQKGVRDRVVIHMPDCGICFSNFGLTKVGSLIEPIGFKKGTTGAGDAFCAGTLLGLYDGVNDRELLEFASMAATVSLSEPDATSGMKKETEIRGICRNFRRKEVCL